MVNDNTRRLDDVSRVPGLVSRQVGNEIVVIDPASQQAHSLSGAAAAVWLATETVGEPLTIDEAARESALSELEALGLVHIAGLSRRSLLTRGGIVVGAGVATIALPAAANAASPAVFSFSRSAAGTYTVPVPKGITRVYFQLTGAGGGGSATDGTATGAAGGNGAAFSGYFDLPSNNQTLGTSFLLTVGGGGRSASHNGAGGAGTQGAPSLAFDGSGGSATRIGAARADAGGGGAATAVFTATSGALLVAGGGGGAGQPNLDGGAGGAGGDAFSGGANGGGNGSQRGQGGSRGTANTPGAGGGGGTSPIGDGLKGMSNGAGGRGGNGGSPAIGGGGGGGATGGGGGGAGTSSGSGNNVKSGGAGGGGGGGNLTADNSSFAVHLNAPAGTAGNAGAINTDGGDGMAVFSSSPL